MYKPIPRNHSVSLRYASFDDAFVKIVEEAQKQLDQARDLKRDYEIVRSVLLANESEWPEARLKASNDVIASWDLKKDHSIEMVDNIVQEITKALQAKDVYKDDAPACRTSFNSWTHTSSLLYVWRTLKNFNKKPGTVYAIFQLTPGDGLIGLKVEKKEEQRVETDIFYKYTRIKPEPLSPVTINIDPMEF